MAVREIKTSISLDGEKAFRQAVNDASRAMRVMNAELKAIGAEFGVTGDKQQFLTQKSNNLRQAIAQQEQIVQALSGAVRESAKEYGDAADQTDGYRIKLANATAALSRMKQELAATDREAEELGRDSTRVGRQIEDGIGDGAKEAQESLRDMMRQMQEDIGSIKGSAAFTVTTQIAGGIVDVVDNLSGFVESSRDYRRQMAYLEESARNAGMDWEEVQNFVFQIASLTGDMDGAAEAMTNLLRTGLKGPDLQNAIDLLTGASILWGDTLKIENLAESLQESIATGEATGAYGELLERLGMDLESYKAAMEGLSEEERAIGSLTFLSNNGLLQTTEEFKERNSALIEAQQEQLKAQQAWAELAEELEPLSTKITEKTTEYVKALTSGIATLKLILSDNAEEAASSLGMSEDELAREWAKKTGNTGLLNDEENQWGIFRTDVGDAFSNIWKGLFGGASAEEAGRNDGAAYAEGMDAAVRDNLPTYDEMMEAYFMGGADALKGWIDSLALSEEDRAAAAEMMRSIGVESGTGFDEGLKTSMNTAIENAKISGSNAAMGVGNGIAASSSYAVRQAWDMANGINAALASIGAGYNAPVIGRYGPSGNGDVYLDGKKVGETIAPTVNASLGKTAGRLTKVG